MITLSAAALGAGFAGCAGFGGGGSGGGVPAPVRRIAAVMSFSQMTTPEGEVDMLRTTEALIDRVTAIGGAFYLPYRLHARRDQVEQAYPAAARFVAAKRHYDPGLLFRNAMWDAYFA